MEVTWRESPVEGATTDARVFLERWRYYLQQGTGPPHTQGQVRKAVLDSTDWSLGVGQVEALVKSTLDETSNRQGAMQEP